jgi:molecular chaperone IbpA|tara:strand:- start:366 stop:827 length:462 start_codon:yes stop_codon:yes gene_type:complete
MTKDLFNLLNSPFFVGFDRMHNRLHEFNNTMTRTQSYPPYNIRREEDLYVVELAVAGFSEDDIDIEIEGDVLKIVGSIGDNKDDSPYLHRGIANRGFTRTFNLSETIEVKNASLINGMLKVFLEDIVPENKKPRKVGINKKEETKGEPQILNG